MPEQVGAGHEKACGKGNRMDLYYRSTRDGAVRVRASQAILKGLSEDGGLFVPEQIPALDIPLSQLQELSYQETAFKVMRLFLTDFSDEDLKRCIEGAYDCKFDTPDIAPLRSAGDAWFLELFHGKTIAFKDMALSILPYLMTTAARMQQDEHEIVILTATSGDTGKAALAGFADVPGTRIIVFYPKHGVSPIQERQMVTQQGDNTFVIGIKGNFDDAQSEVKAIFSDAALREEMDRKGFCFSSANSINIGRLVPQIVYYVYAYGRLCKEGAVHPGEKINITVPTGNFGNILAAFYAKQMGLPVGKLICASNENRVLTDFFTEGVYDKNRPFVLTSSPSMDILISSNLERLIFRLCGNDPDRCRELMRQLAAEGKYEITQEMRAELQDFAAGCADEAQTAAEIGRMFREEGYVLDPHTAVASAVYRGYREDTGDETPTVIAGTASPFKFTRSVMKALGEETDGDDLALADRLSGLSKVPLPQAVETLKGAPILHDTVVERAQMKDAVRRILNL